MPEAIEEVESVPCADRLMQLFEVLWNRGVCFSCGKKRLSDQSSVRQLAEDLRYMAEIEQNERGIITEVNFQKIRRSELNR